MEIGATLSPDVFTVRNSGAGTVAYTISDNVDWLSVSPATGTSAGEQDPITITYDVSSLRVSNYTAIISVTDPNAINSPQTLTVTLSVKYHPGDMDRDNDVDLEDFGRFQRCLSGEGIAQTDSACARS